MALREWPLDHRFMENHSRMPRVGDRVRIKGFLGVFEIVEVGLRGSMVDVKHLDSPGPAYIEREVLWHELEYPQAQQPAPVASSVAQRPAGVARRAGAQAVQQLSTSPAT